MIRFQLALAAMALSSLLPAAQGATPAEPGPESGGLRLRLTVESAQQRVEGFTVRIDLVNVSGQSVVLRGGWEGDETGDVKEYLEAATGIESAPAMMPWRGGLAARFGERNKPQPELTLKASEVLSLSWKTRGRELKNRVVNPLDVANPTFRLPGLYSVHATIDVITAAGTFHLRSNEQLVSIGCSHATPKSTYGQLFQVNRKKKTALLNVGGKGQIQVGDKFEITSKVSAWRFTVTEVHPSFSEGTLELVARDEFRQETEPPAVNAHASLITE